MLLWLLLLGGVGFCWGLFCRKSLEKALATRKQLRLARNKRKIRLRDKLTKRCNRHRLETQMWSRQFSCLVLACRMCAGARRKRSRGRHFLRPKVVRLPEKAWALKVGLQLTPQHQCYASWLQDRYHLLRGGSRRKKQRPQEGPAEGPSLAQTLSNVLDGWAKRQQQQRKENISNDTSQDGLLARKLMAVLKQCLNKNCSDQQVAQQLRAELAASGQHVAYYLAPGYP